MLKAKPLLVEAFLYVIAKLVPGLISLLYLILFTRLLGITEFGKYSLFIAQFNLIASLSFGWLNQSELRYRSANKSDSDRPSYFILIFFASLISLFVTIIFYLINQISFDKIFLSFFCIFSIGIFGYVKIILQSDIKPKEVLFGSIIQSILLIMIPIIFYFVAPLNYNNLLISMGLSYFITCIIFLIKNFHVLNLSFFKINDFAIKIIKWLKYGVPISIWSTVGLSMSFFDRFFIDKFYDAQALGAYSSISELSMRIFSFIIFPFTMALHPRINRLWNNQKQKEAVKIIELSIRIIMSLLILILILFFLFENFVYDIVKLIIPTIPYEVLIILFPLILSGIFWQLSFFSHKIIELKEKTYLMVLFIIISMIINLIGNLYFLPRYGIIATACTSSISSFFYFFITYLYFLNQKFSY